MLGSKSRLTITSINTDVSASKKMKYVNKNVLFFSVGMTVLELDAKNIVTGTYFIFGREVGSTEEDDYLLLEEVLEGPPGPTVKKKVQYNKMPLNYVPYLNDVGTANMTLHGSLQMVNATDVTIRRVQKDGGAETFFSKLQWKDTSGVLRERAFEGSTFGKLVYVIASWAGDILEQS